MSKPDKFDISFYTQLNNLEERFLQQDVEKDDLEKLILCIGELVQHYDLKKDHIKFYFIEKMQYILSRPYTLQVLKGEKKQLTANHKHNFSLPVLRIEKQAQVQTDLNESFGKIKQLQDDFESQERDQVHLIKRDMDNQINEVLRKIKHRKQKSIFCHGENKLVNQSFITNDEEQDTISPIQQ